MRKRAFDQAVTAARRVVLISPKRPAGFSFVSASALGADCLCSAFGENPEKQAAKRESLGRLVEVWA